MSVAADMETKAQAEAGSLRVRVEWVAMERLGRGRMGEPGAAALLPDGSVLYAAVRGGGKRDGLARVVFCHLPDVGALANRKSPWTGRRRPVMVVLPPDKTLVKDLTLPTESLAEAEMMLSNEVETLSPFEAERTHYSFVTRKTGQAGRTGIRCFLAEQATVAKACEPFAKAGIPVCGLVPSGPASAAGLRGLAEAQGDRLYVICQHRVAESVVVRGDGTFASRVGLLGMDGQATGDLAREVLTSLSVFGHATGQVYVAGLAAEEVQGVARRVGEMNAARPVALRPLECDGLGDVPEALRVEAIRLAGALWLQGTEPEQMARACIVPPSYRKDLEKRRVVRQDLHWVGICLAIGLVGASALAVGNLRMERLAGRVEREIAPYVGVASQVAAQREQLIVARRQLDNRDLPLRILTGLAEVTPNGVFFYKVSLTSESVLVIDGVADSLHLAFELPEFLRKSSLFAQIQLNYAQQSKVGEHPLVEFRCTCRVAPARPGEGRP